MYFTIKPQEGIVATSFKPGDKVFIGGDKLLPLEKCVLTFLSLRCPSYLAQSGLTSSYLGSFPSPSPHQVLLSPSVRAVLAVAVVVPPVVVVDSVLVVAVEVAAASVVAVVVSPVVVVGAALAVVSVVAGEGPFLTNNLSSYGVWGIRELFAGIFPFFLCILTQLLLLWLQGL